MTYGKITTHSRNRISHDFKIATQKSVTLRIALKIHPVNALAEAAITPFSESFNQLFSCSPVLVVKLFCASGGSRTLTRRIVIVAGPRDLLLMSFACIIEATTLTGITPSVSTFNGI